MLRGCGLISLVFFGLCECAPELLMRIFTHDAPLIGIGAGYLRIAGWSYLLTGDSQCYLAIMKVTATPQTAMYSRFTNHLGRW